MSNDTIIRDLEPADVEAVVAIAVAAWEPIFAFFRHTLGEELFTAAHPDCRVEKARQVRAVCDPRSGAMICVAEQSGRVVGFATFYVNDVSRIGEMGNNAVHPDFQGMGIGSSMYQHIFKVLKKAEMRFVRVRTGGDPSHAPARGAYEKAGFSIEIPHVEYYRRL